MIVIQLMVRPGGLVAVQQAGKSTLLISVPQRIEYS
jgi:hypothetical protein